MLKQTKKVINVSITGSAGNIAFSLIPLFCNGIVFGLNQKVSLNLIGIITN